MFQIFHRHRKIFPSTDWLLPEELRNTQGCTQHILADNILEDTNNYLLQEDIRILVLGIAAYSSVLAFAVAAQARFGAFLQVIIRSFTIEDFLPTATEAKRQAIEHIVETAGSVVLGGRDNFEDIDAVEHLYAEDAEDVEDVEGLEDVECIDNSEEAEDVVDAVNAVEAVDAEDADDSEDIGDVEFVEMARKVEFVEVVEVVVAVAVVVVVVVVEFVVVEFFAIAVIVASVKVVVVVQVEFVVADIDLFVRIFVAVEYTVLVVGWVVVVCFLAD